MITLATVDLVLRGAACAEGLEEVGGANRGRAVERILKVTRLGPGNPWCAAWIADIGTQMLRHQWPLPKTASCDVLLEHARARGVLYHTPQAGDVFLVMRNERDAIHTGFVVKLADDGSWSSIEGNTNPSGGREGYGVFRRTRGGPADRQTYHFIRWTQLLGGR